MRGNVNKRNKQVKSSSTTTGDDGDDHDKDDTGAPTAASSSTAAATTAATTRLRQQSYVGRRPGAYLEGPGGASVRAPAPTTTGALLVVDEEAVTSSSSSTRPPERPREHDPSTVPSSLPPPPQDVLLEAEPVWEAEPVLSVIATDASTSVVPLEVPGGKSSTEELTGSSQRKLTRRTVAILVVAGVVVVIAAVVGGVLGAASNNSDNNTNRSETSSYVGGIEPTHEPTPGVSDAVNMPALRPSNSLSPGAVPTLPPPPTAAPTTACEEEVAVLTSCLATTGQSSQCKDELAAVTSCVTDAGQSTDCPNEQTAFTSCVDSVGVNTAACESCLEDFVGSLSSGGSDGLTCNEVNGYFCGAMDACPECGACLAPYLALWSCYFVGACDAFNCTSTPTAPSTNVPPAASPAASGLPTPAPTYRCPEELTIFVECVDSTGSTDSCVSCISGYTTDTNSTCADSESYTCGLMDACPGCGDCEDEWTAYNNCLNVGVCDAFNCTSTPTAPSTIPPPPATAPPA